MEKTRRHVHPGAYQVTENNARNALKHFSSKCRNDLWGKSTAQTPSLVKKKLLTFQTSRLVSPYSKILTMPQCNCLKSTSNIMTLISMEIFTYKFKFQQEIASSPGLIFCIDFRVDFQWCRCFNSIKEYV